MGQLCGNGSVSGGMTLKTVQSCANYAIETVQIKVAASGKSSPSVGKQVTLVDSL